MACLHPRHIHKQGRVHRTGVAQDADGHPFTARHGLGREPQGLDLGHHPCDLGVGGVLVHDDEHGALSTKRHGKNADARASHHGRLTRG